MLAGAFHDAGTDRQSEFPAEVVVHSIFVGFAGADVGRDRFKPEMRLQVADERSQVDLAYVGGLAAGHVRCLKPPLLEQFFERELSHRKLDVRFARFRRASFTTPQEIVTQRARTPRHAFHGRGERPKADRVGFQLVIIADSTFVIASPFLERWPGDRRGSCSSGTWLVSAALRALSSAVTNQT